MSPLERDQVFQMRLTAAERKMLDKLADQRGLTASDFIRQLIRESQATKSGVPLEDERQRLQTRLTIVWEDLGALPGMATKRERADRATAARSALAHAAFHMNSILPIAGLKPLDPLSGPDRNEEEEE